MRLMRNDILLYRHLGCSYETIASEVEVSPRTISAYLKDNPPTDQETAFIEKKVLELQGNAIQDTLSPNAALSKKPKLIKTTSDIANSQIRMANLMKHLESDT